MKKNELTRIAGKIDKRRHEKYLKKYQKKKRVTQGSIFKDALSYKPVDRTAMKVTKESK